MTRHHIGSRSSDNTRRIETLPSPFVYRVVLWPLLSVYIVYVLATYAAFVYCTLRRKDRALIERSLFMTTLQTATGTIFGINALLRGALWRYPCFIDIWLVYTNYILWVMIVILTMLRYYVLAISQKALTARLRELPVTPENLNEHLKHLYTIFSKQPIPEINSQNNLFQCEQSYVSSASESKAASIESVTELSESPIQYNSNELVSDASVRTGEDAFRRTVTRSIGSIHEIAPFAFDSPPAAHTTTPESQHQHRQTLQLARQTYGQQREVEDSLDQSLDKANINNIKWLRRLTSKRFITCVIGSLLAIVLVVLIIMNIFSPNMSLRHIHYNCNRGWEYYPAAVYTLLFSIVICPAFLIKTWSHQDGYGIRASLAVSSVAGIVSWVGAVTWRILTPRGSLHISSSMFYLAQVICVHTCFVMYPVIKSIGFIKQQHTGTRDTELVQEDARMWALGAPQTEYDLSKQSFFCAMRDAEEHRKIKAFAVSCFCGELVSFLDVYLALKTSIYMDLNHYYSCQRTTPNSQGNSFLEKATGDGAVDCFGALNSNSTNTNDSLNMAPLLPKSIYSSSCPNRQAEKAGIPVLPHEQKSSTNATFSSSSNHHVAITVPDAGAHDEILQDAEMQTHIPRFQGASRASNGLQCPWGISNLSTGIVESMQLSFPNLEINENTLIPEYMRGTVNLVIKLYILSESPLAINAPSEVVTKCKAYLTGGQAPYSVLDQAKNEVVDMLYSNVYLRYRQN